MKPDDTPAVDVEKVSRPGVPMEKQPQPLAGTHWVRPERQGAAPGVTHRAELDGMTPVFGTAQPLKGLSGVLRRTAYDIPETMVRHWALLLLADRVDVLEARLPRLAAATALVAPLALGGFFALRALRTS